jgi:ABC-type antimicrobial peptide transport system permease subunit
VGLLAGVGLALGAAAAAQSLLFGLKPNDPAMLAVSVGALAALALAGSYIPARRAARLAPMTALRQE